MTKIETIWDWDGHCRVYFTRGHLPDAEFQEALGFQPDIVHRQWWRVSGFFDRAYVDSAPGRGAFAVTWAERFEPVRVGRSDFSQMLESRRQALMESK